MKYNTQMINNQNVPKLRFKEFSGEWEEKNFEDIFSFSTGKNIKQNEASPEFETPCVRYGELYHMYGEVISEIINKTNLDKSELLFSQGNEILLPSAGEDPLDIGSASALTVANVAIGRTINILKPLLDNVYSQKYAAYYINQKLRKKISTLAKGVSISNVYNSDLKKLSINLPCLSEQQKIASFLSAIDTKIDQLTKKQTLLKQYKKGVMQKIFSQELRFKADDGSEFSEWEQKTIADCITESKIKGDTGDKAKKLTVKLWNKGVFAKNEIISGSENTQYYIRKAGQFIYSKLDFLNCAFGIIPENLDGYQSTIDLPCFDFINNTNPIFFLSRVSRKDFYLHFGEQADGSRKARRINQNIFLEMPILLPSVDEQTKIANFLSAIDTEITLRQAQGERLKQFKKGLLQQMFV